jgi:transcriptional regulator with XRE-family HTH domain
MYKSLRSPRHQKLRQLLVDARKAGGWTQDQLAAKVGKPQSFVAKYEVGERRLDLIELIDVIRALDRDPMAIIAEIVGLGEASESDAIQPET